MRYIAMITTAANTQGNQISQKLSAESFISNRCFQWVQKTITNHDTENIKHMCSLPKATLDEQFMWVSAR